VYEQLQTKLKAFRKNNHDIKLAIPGLIKDLTEQLSETCSSAPLAAVVLLKLEQQLIAMAEDVRLQRIRRKELLLYFKFLFSSQIRIVDLLLYTPLRQSLP
jgi:hypothetical protein